MRDRRHVEVDAHGALRYGPEQRGAVAFAASGVEHALAGREAARESVAVPVLVGNFAAAARQETLAGECCCFG